MDWNIVEHPRRQQPYTLWHNAMGGPPAIGCPVATPHVHIFADKKEKCEMHIADQEARISRQRGQ